MIQIQEESFKVLNSFNINKSSAGGASTPKLLSCKNIDDVAWSFRKAKYFLKLSLSLVALCYVTSVEASQVQGTVSRVGDATHIEFKGLSEWDYDLSREGKSKIKLTIPAFDQVTETKLVSWDDRLIESIKVEKSGPNSKYVVHFTLAGKEVESFDYLTDDPSRLIIDFYKQATPTAPINNSEVAQQKPTAKPKTAKSRKSVKKRNSLAKGYQKRKRSPAGSEILQANEPGHDLKFLGGGPMRGVFDGGDPSYQRFKIRDYEIREEAVIASRQNIYIRFPIVKMKNKRFEELVSNPPEYVIKPTDSRENKEARLLKVLYEKGRNASFLKTYSYFIKKYPDSIYDEIVRNMAAEVHFKMWKESKEPFHEKQYRNIYRHVLNKYPGSVLADRTELILAYSHLVKKEGIETLRSFLQYVKAHPRSEERDRAHLAIADGYMFVKKPEDAMKVYKKLEKKADNKIYSIEATFRRGDVFMDQRKYKQAIAEYKRAIRKYPSYVGVFPNAQYNMSEAQFWLGQYQKGLGNFVEFLRLFPSHEHGGYAMTRIGELLEILGADRSRVIGAFVESYFRFRSSPGADVARIRMLSQRLKGMREKEVKKALAEMHSISKNSKLPRISEFTTLMEADGLHRRGEYQRALDTLVTYYQKYPTSADLKFFRKRILRNISDVINEELKKGDFLSALQINGLYTTNWLRNNERIDIPYFVAKAYEQSGVLADAKINYEKIRKKLKRIQGTKEQKERKVTEHLPSLDQVNLRLASIALEQRKYRDAYNYIKNVKNDLNEKEAVERVSVAAKVALKRGESRRAKKLLRQLIGSWQGKPDLLAKTHLELAELELSSNDFEDAEDLVSYIDELDRDKLSDDILAKSMEIKGDIQLKKGQPVSAIESYLNLLESFEEKRPLSNIRYKVGQILFERGDIKGAEKVWGALNNERGKFYYSLAKEKLDHAKWQDGYKKYINRIPAAAEIR